MLKILVLSDTHLQEPGGLPGEVFKAAEDVDLILHAGDFTGREILEWMEKRAEVFGVRGNMDGPEITALLPTARQIDVEGVRLGLTHSSGSPERAVYNARARFDDADIIVFGHNHCPHKETMKGVMMFNPGSPTDRRFAPYCSYGLIEVNKGRFTTRIVQLDDAAG